MTQYRWRKQKCRHPTGHSGGTPRRPRGLVHGIRPCAGNRPYKLKTPPQGNILYNRPKFPGPRGSIVPRRPVRGARYWLNIKTPNPGPTKSNHRHSNPRRWPLAPPPTVLYRHGPTRLHPQKLTPVHRGRWDPYNRTNNVRWQLRPQWRWHGNNPVGPKNR